MENKLEMTEVIKPRKLSNEELLQKKVREAKISRTRASVVRSQIVKAYEVLENIRFDFVSDTAFRDMITRAKSSLENALNDFLLSDNWQESQVNKFKKMTPKEFGKYLNQSTATAKSVVG